MINLFYVEYPFGNSETFVEYEMRAIAENTNIEFTIYVLKKPTKNIKRFIPNNAKIVFIENYSLNSYIKAFLKLFKITSVKEISKIIKNNFAEGFSKCLYRIFRYNVTAAEFYSIYKKTHIKDSNDIFVSYWLNECAFALTELKKKYPNIRIASRGHGFDVFEDRCYMPFRKSILSGLDKIFLINNTSKLYFHQKYKDWFDVSKIEIAHLGVSLPEVLPKSSDKDVFRIVTCSAVIPLKRLDLIIDALSEITNIKVEWVHFGDGLLFDEIKAYAKEKLSKSSVKYIFCGQTPLKDIHNYYASTPVHLFVNCSDTEGTPVSIMEAMAYGIPAIARDVGGINEVIDESCGMLIPAEENVEELKKAIEHFIKLDNSQYIQFCENAAKKIKNDFNAEINFKEYIKNVCSL